MIFKDRYIGLRACWGRAMHAQDLPVREVLIRPSENAIYALKL